MLNHTTHLIAKIDPVKYFLSKASLTGWAAKWVFILSEFDIVYKDHKVIKGQVIADELVEAPLQGDHPIVADIPDDTIMIVTPSTPWKLFLMVPSHKRDRGQEFCLLHRKETSFLSLIKFHSLAQTI